MGRPVSAAPKRAASFGRAGTAIVVVGLDVGTAVACRLFIAEARSRLSYSGRLFAKRLTFTHFTNELPFISVCYGEGMISHLKVLVVA